MMFNEDYERYKMRAEDCIDSALHEIRLCTASTGSGELNRQKRTERDALEAAHKEVCRAKAQIEQAMALSEPAVSSV